MCDTIIYPFIFLYIYTYIIKKTFFWFTNDDVNQLLRNFVQNLHFQLQTYIFLLEI